MDTRQIVQQIKAGERSSTRAPRCGGSIEESMVELGGADAFRMVASGEAARCPKTDRSHRARTRQWLRPQSKASHAPWAVSQTGASEAAASRKVLRHRRGTLPLHDLRVAAGTGAASVPDPGFGPLSWVLGTGEIWSQRPLGFGRLCLSVSSGPTPFVRGPYAALR